MAPPLLILNDIHLTFGGTPLLTGAELVLGEGERLCLVGRNGSGKSTLLKVAAALVEPDRGERSLRQGTTIRYLPQEPDLRGFASVGAYVEAGLAPGDDPHRARRLLADLGLAQDADPGLLSGGEVRRAALARTLAPAPDLLLLDEPTNHLDLPAIEWLEAELDAMRTGLVLISHDRRFLERLGRATVWLDRGQTRRLEQGFAGFEAWRDKLLEEEEQSRQRLNRKIAAEQEWVRYGVTARRKRNMGRLRALEQLRQDRREQRGPLGDVRFGTTDAAVSGRLVIEIQGLTKAFGARQIVRNLDLRIRRGDRLGIIGPNGAGKTTLLRLLTNSLPADAGTVRLGSNLTILTLDQTREALDPALSLADTLTGGVGDTVFVGDGPRHVMSYMKDFLFMPEQARTAVAALSGGERGRLLLARALARPANLLILDEPTNDLDLETLDLLQELLAEHAATVLLVSHDRDFLDRVATSVLAFEGAGHWQAYAGGYSDMVVQRGHGVVARQPVAAPPPRARPPIAAPVEAAGPRRLSSKEKRALETLPTRIEALAAELAALEVLLADPGLYRRDAAAFTQLSSELATTRERQAALEEQWLELEMLREALEN